MRLELQAIYSENAADNINGHRTLAQDVSKAFDNIPEEIENQIDSVSKRVSLPVGPIFGSPWLAKRLGEFRHDNPGIQLSIHHGSRISGALDLATPLAVDWGHGKWTGLDSKHLFDIAYSPVLSPRLMDELGCPSIPADLLRMPIIHRIDGVEWNARFGMAGIKGAEYTNETTIVDSNLVLQAALNSQGVALGVLPFLHNEIESGGLVMPSTSSLNRIGPFFLFRVPAL